MFFFFFDSIYEVIKECLNIYLKANFDSKRYCDISELFSDKITKNEMKESVGAFSKEVKYLYESKYPENEKDLNIISKLYENEYRSNIINKREAFAILFWCFKIFKKRKPFEEHKKEIMKNLMDFINIKLNKKSYRNFESVIYDDEEVVLHPVDSVAKLLEVLEEYSKEEVLYFRGHSKTSYQLKPSILRTEKLKENENLIFQELLISCPGDFRGFKNHIDYLVKMQHYGLPTRLLDITRNPLVSLYFSCCDNMKDMGEVIIFSPKKHQIKYENSDTVSMIASLPMFSYDEQTNLMDNLKMKQKSANSIDDIIIERFVHEIQTEKPGFTNKIDFKDLESCFVVLPKKDNSRIVKQDGAFIICGINENPEDIINRELRLKSEGKTVVIFITNKEKIRDELDLLSINKSSLFPEIDSVSDYIKNKYSD